MNQKLSKKFILPYLLWFFAVTADAGVAAQMPKKNLENNMQRLNKKIEAQRDEIRRLKAIISDLKPDEVPDHDRPVEHLVPSIANSAPPSAFGSDPIAKSFLDEDTIADSSHEAMHVYYKGLEAFESKRYDSAVKLFSQFVSINPHHPYADRAQFYVAESAFQSKEYNLALVATNLLEARYPYSLKLPEVLNRRSLSLFHLNQKDQAKDVLDQLTKAFPNHPIVDETRKGLAGVRLSPPPLLTGDEREKN